MKKVIKIKEKNKSTEIVSEFGRKLYSVQESYWIFYKGIRTMRFLIRAKKKGELSSQFIERLMLAVTEVNDCAICSYAHTKRALETGMTSEEIHKMLSGIMDDVPDNELAAVMFAQHYADSRGNHTLDSWERVIDIYGKSAAFGILGSIRMIMIGNTYGIPWSSFFNRLRGRADPRSSLSYELSMMLGSILIPVAVIHALLADLFRKPIIDF